ncbi:protein brambleberry-like isoform X1 [Carassius carassius]|uniref:protein brambleberry-like isoform X1 n=1 Tax=Carassius carassius TaxID=217509 RepID=UPI002868BF87|nr:protein brambleberry-like isoform X1 [Carassius carassius]
MGLWFVMLWVFSMQYGEVDAFFDWLKKSAQAPDPAPAPPEETIAPILLHGETPAFEMSVVDEKFLAEAKQMELSPLDSCHFRVVARLKAACSGLSEEQLAKLGVALFNCQSEVEGRRTYPCTEEMSIKECTMDMDSDTWSAYHIVSNRARSVCYATRQQHFRKRAELTVNALISTATNQLDAMKDLKEGQKELKEMTAVSLDKLLEGHSALQLQQGALKEGQGQLDASISQNLRRLAQEKALISTGQQLVAQLIQGITQRMENVSGQLKDQSAEVQEGHQAILKDLAVVRGSAQDIHEKMELNLNSFLQQQNTTARFYSELMTKLERMNGTLGYMLTYLDNMQHRLEDRLLMIQGYLGWAGLSLHALWTCVMHAGYFLLSAVLLSFLQCATFSRVSLLLLVPINAIAEINQQSALDLLSLTMLLFTLSLGHWFVLQMLWALSKIKGQTCSPAPLPIGPPKEKTPGKRSRSTENWQVSSSTPVLNDPGCDLEVESFMMGDPDILSMSPSQSHGPKFRHLITGTPNHSTPRLKSRHSIGADMLDYVPQKNLVGVLETVNHSRSSSPNHSLASNSSFSGRLLCSGITRLGQPCKKRALVGQDYCRLHEGGHTSYSRLRNEVH